MAPADVMIMRAGRRMARPAGAEAGDPIGRPLPFQPTQQD
jgi:hypothetical protein